MFKGLTDEMLGELRAEITGYFEAYYSALRSKIAGHDALYESVPQRFKGSRRVSTSFCRDGVVVVHEPAERDSYEFRSVLDRWAEDVVAEYTPTLPSGESVIILDYSPYHDFGAFSITEPLRIEEGGTVYEVGWTRMDVASWNNLGLWKDKREARKQARHDLRPYLG